MPKIIVSIDYDGPLDPYWLNPDNLKSVLEDYCKNTKFNVEWAENGNPWRHEEDVQKVEEVKHHLFQRMLRVPE